MIRSSKGAYTVCVEINGSELEVSTHESREQAVAVEARLEAWVARCGAHLAGIDVEVIRGRLVAEARVAEAWRRGHEMLVEAVNLLDDAVDEGPLDSADEIQRLYEAITGHLGLDRYSRGDECDRAEAILDDIAQLDLRDHEHAEWGRSMATRWLRPYTMLAWQRVPPARARTGRATCPACRAPNEYDLPLDDDGQVECHACGAVFVVADDAAAAA